MRERGGSDWHGTLDDELGWRAVDGCVEHNDRLRARDSDMLYVKY